MFPVSHNVRRHVLAWDRPLLPQAVAWLAGEWQGGAPLDLRGWLVVVPTRQSGRRLREALAEYAAQKKQAVFAPAVRTPDSLLTEAEKAPDVASRLEAQLAWTQVLRALDFAALPDLFPVPPPSADFGWAWRLAESFFRLQTQLSEGGLAFADVAPRAGENFAEAQRWNQLAELERRQVEMLGGIGRREPHAARREFARNPPLPAGVSRVALLAAPDPLPLALDVLAQWALQVPVEVGVFCAADDVEAFDSWGRPLAAKWEHRPLGFEEFEERVHLCANPAAEATRAATATASYGRNADGVLAFGLADPEVLPLLENELSRRGLHGFNPEGRLRRSESLYTLLSSLAAFARDPSFDAVAALARCPDFLTALVARLGPEGSAARWLKALDDLRTRYLPADWAAAVRSARNLEAKPELQAGLSLLGELQGVLSSPFPVTVTAALKIIFHNRRFDLSRDYDARAADTADAWAEILRESAAAARDFPDVSSAEWWEVALKALGQSRRAEDKPAGALDLQGWLELLWEDAPHLVVAGMNDGLVPDAIVGDAFLPESLRQTLGLKTNEARFARDAYLLDALLASRRAGGRVDLLLAKVSAAGDPLRPSRLLLRCDEAELPRRVVFLFRAAEAPRASPPWTRAWKLAPRRTPEPERVAVTGLRAWLACPFRFYLSHVLRMEAVDPAKTELDARDFGTICHAALEAMARAPALRDCTDEKTLREFLLAAFDRVTRERFGGELTLPLVVQLESARQRLAKAAAVQARQRGEGWVTDRVEWEFALELGGLEVRGKIDRIDRHESSGAWRVLDYKTSDAFAPPHKTHLRPWRASDGVLPAWMRVSHEGRELVWTDLQLPLYLRALAQDGTAPAATAGYFNLPKAVAETAVALWSELTPELLTAANACAEGVAAAIRTGRFWPPVELPPDRDPFAALFHHGAEDSVTWHDRREMSVSEKVE